MSGGDPTDPGSQLVCVGFLPYFHLAGLAALVIMMMAGGIKVVAMSRYSTTRLLQVIQDYKVLYCEFYSNCMIKYIK